MSDSDDSGREWRVFVVDMISFGDLPPLLGVLRKVGATGADEVFKA